MDLKQATLSLSGGVAEWFGQGPAKPRTTVRFRPPPPARTPSASPAVVSVLNGVQVPGSGYAVEFIVTAIGEEEPGARDQVSHGTRHPHRVGFRQRGDACSDMHRNASDVVPSDFNFAGVDATPYFKVKLAGGISNGTGAFDGTSGTIEGREEPASRCFVLPAPTTRQLTTNGVIVPIKQVTPMPIAKLARPLRRLDDVREENRREHTVD